MSSETMTGDEAPAQPSMRDSVRAIAAASIGNLLESFDFTIFGYMVASISVNFFPKSDHTAALLYTFLVFGTGFVLRPIGGIVVGRIGDRYGRRPALILTISMMVCATVVMGLLPTYASVGIAAPMLLVAARLAQGFSLGGQWGGAAVFIAEWSRTGRRGLFTSLHQVSSIGGSLLASALGAALTTLLTPESMVDWGWRVPFLLGAVFLPIGLYLQLNAPETPSFKVVEEKYGSALPSNTRENVMGALRLIGISVGWTGVFYTFVTYMPSFTRVHLHLTQAQSLWSTSAGLLVAAACVPLMGGLSDRVGRRPMLLIPSAICVLVGFPLFWFLLSGVSFAVVVALQIAAGVMIACWSGPAPAMLTELFPTRGRSMWLSGSYSCTVAIFGGFAPYFSEKMIELTGSELAPTAYIMIVAAITFLTVLKVRETAHEPLR